MDSTMRILFVWLTAIIVCFIITIGWYVSLGLVTSISSQALTDITGQGLNLLNLLQYVSIAWGPFFDIIVLLWAFMNSQADDAISIYR